MIVSYPDFCLFLNFGAHVQYMLEMSRCLYSGGNFSKMFGKTRREIVALFTIMI